MSDLFGNVKRPTSKQLLGVYDAVHRERFGVPAPIVGKKDGPNAARLLRRYNFEHLCSCLHVYFDVPDRFIQQGGFTFGVFVSCIGKVIQHEQRVKAARAQQIERQAPSETFLEIQRQVRAEWGSS